MRIKLLTVLSNRKNTFVDSSAGRQADPIVIALSIKPPSGRKEPAYRVMTLIFALVLALHVGCAFWFTDPMEAPPRAKPLDMQISLVKVTKPKAAIPPPASAKRQLSPKKKPQAKHKLITPEIVDTPSEFAPAEQAFTQATTLNAANPMAPQPASQIDTPLAPQPDDNARYAHNPAPDYPGIALSRGWQGKVLLRVLVSATGSSEAVTVEQSSGYEILDESALEAVKNWQFTPARQGDTAMDSTVIVPIIFSLRDQ